MGIVKEKWRVEKLEHFTHYRINETAQGNEVILYLNENTTEFSAELGTVSSVEESNIKKEAVSYVKKMLPSLKINSIKIMAGGMLLSVLGLGALPTQKASAAKSTVPQSQTATLPYTVKAGDTLYSIAQKSGTTVNDIKNANHLSSDILQVGQILQIPTGVSVPPTYTNKTTYMVVSGDTLYAIANRNGTTVDAIKKANGLTSNSLKIGQELTIPSNNPSVPTPKVLTHQVVSGDTLYGIAARNGTTVDAIKRANQLTSNFLEIGMELTIPLGHKPTPTKTNEFTYKVISGDTLYSIAKRNGTTVDAIKKANQLSSNSLKLGQLLTIQSAGTSAPATDIKTTYKVVSGDTLYSIAKRNGTSVEAIKKANRLTSNSLKLGQVLAIPSVGTPAPAKQSVTLEIQSVDNQEELDWLAKMIYSEGRGETLEGQIAIGAVIMNRVKSPLFPNNIKDVLFEKSYGYYQFTPAETGAINTATPNAQNIEAAKRAINGEDPTNGALFFYNPDKTSSSYLRSRTVSTTIGNHVFAF